MMNQEIYVIGKGVCVIKPDRYTSRNLFDPLLKILAITLFLALFLSCSKGGSDAQPEPTQSGEIKGSVKGENSNPYPGTNVVFLKDSERVSKFTNTEGEFQCTTKDIGTYDVRLILPLSTRAISVNPATVNVTANQAASVDFVIKPKPATAHLNFGDVQLLEEIVDKDGNTPTALSEPLFAKNIFDAPLGLLTEIRAPDGHQITLAEFKKAKGNIVVNCNGSSSTVEIALEGMIPNGTYTFWLAFMKKKVKVGEPIDFANDFVNFTNPPVGASNGSENAVIAGANGTLNATIQHSSCILTDYPGLVIPILYHLNGKTFGGGHVPDAEEMAHMLVYFQ